MLFGKNMSDFEKLMFTEDYIKVLKKALREKERNEANYVKNVENVIQVFREASSKFSKIYSYKREMIAHKAKADKAVRLTDKLERKNYQLRMKIREQDEIIEGLKKQING